MTWLFSTAQQDQARNYHDEEKAEIVSDFIGDVMAYMRQQSQKVVVIGHNMGATDCWVGRVGLYQSLEQVRNEFLFLDSQGGLSLWYLYIHRNVFRLAWAFNMSRNWPSECGISDLWLLQPQPLALDHTSLRLISPLL